MSLASASPREKRRPHRIHGPRTVADVLATGAAGGVLLLTVFLALQGRNSFSRSPAARGPNLPPEGSLLAREHLGGENRLLFPVPATSPNAVADSFTERRGTRMHLAVDIMAPRGSAVVAVADGTVVRLSSSQAGGISIYQLDAAERRCFFYAHLQGYAAGLAEGQPVKRGHLVGYIGTTGNAAASAPHLHFAISEVTDPKQWWGGTAVDPSPLWK